MKELHRKFKELRLAQNIPAELIYRKLDCSKAMFSMMENGRRQIPLATAETWARLINTELLLTTDLCQCEKHNATYLIEFCGQCNLPLPEILQTTE